jgi:hypothetical protein
MTKKRRPASDPDVRRKVLEAMRNDVARDQQHTTTELAKLEELERFFLHARSDLPAHRPIEREILLVYINRRKRLIEVVGQGGNSALQDDVLKEIEQLEGYLWGPEWGEKKRQALDQIWGSEFWSDLQTTGVPIPGAVRVIASLMPPQQGRPVSKRTVAVQALQMQLTGKTWREITEALCECGKAKHTASCHGAMRQSVAKLKRALAAYGIEASIPDADM